MKSKYTTLITKYVFIKSIFPFILASILCLAGHATSIASTVVLQWDPNTDTDLNGYKVYYQADSSSQPFTGTPVTIPKSQTTATISGLDPAHAYFFAVTAYNTSSVESSYSNIVTVPELVSPTIFLTSPTNNSSVGGTVSINASASDNVGVSKVEYYVNGTLQATDTSTPYVYSWNTSTLASGTYTLMAKAYDAAGNVGQSANVSTTVVNDTTVPTVSLTAPANNATVSGTVSITATADDNVGVNKVEFYENGVLLSATNVSPYSYSWNTTAVANGSYILTAKSYDSTGNVGQSGNVTVTVSNGTTSPTVSLTTSANGTTLTAPATITLTATATAGGTATISSVNFYNGTTMLNADTTAPYAYTWSNVAPGTYSLTAKISNSLGEVVASAPVMVTVSAVPAAPTLLSPSGTTATSTPTFTWNAIPNATSYTLWNGNSGFTTYTSAAAGCSTGTGTCSATLATPLPAGTTFYWGVKATNASGSSPYSAYMPVTFGIIPDAPTLVGPNGPVLTALPTYTWNAVSNATSYTLWNGNSGFATYSPTSAGCPLGTGTCSATLATPLPAGTTYYWGVKASSSAGTSPYSAYMSVRF